MSGAVVLAWRHLVHHRGRSLLLAACITVALALPAVTRTLVARFDAALYARAETVPMVVGAKGSRFDLVFAALYFRPTDLASTPLGLYESLRDEDGATAIPIHAAFTAQGETVVATSIEYLEHRGLALADGRSFTRAGEAVLGAAAALRLGATAGSKVFTDQLHHYDITAPSAVRLDVTGVLAPTGTSDDDAVFVDLETAWVLEGIAHGHQDAAEVERPDLLIGRSDEHVALSGAVVTHQEVTDANAASFHVHGDRADLPLTAVLVFPRDQKASTILRARINASPGHQAVVPTRVVDDLMAFVVRVQRLFDAAAIVLGVSTVALLGLIVALSYRVRAEEIRTLVEIGCSRGTVAMLFAAELVIIAAVAAGAAAAITVGAVAVVARWSSVV